MSAASRGWGPGWPKGVKAADLKWVTAPSGAKWQVHKDVAVILQAIVDQAEARGYKFHYAGQVRDDWGYANRAIRGTKTPSNHSWGLAVDIDATKYPQGQRRARPPQWLVDLFAKYGWAWGGNWSYADPMHFEFMWTRLKAQQMSAMISGAKGNPAPPEPPKQLPSRPTLKLGDRGRMVEIVQWELSAASGENLSAELGVYWGQLKDAVHRLGKVLGKNWDGTTIGTEQWNAIDFLYMVKGHDPVLS